MGDLQLNIGLPPEPLKPCGAIDLDGTRCETLIPTNDVACAHCLATVEAVMRTLAPRPGVTHG